MNNEEEPMYDVFANTHTERVWVAKCLNANVAELLATNLLNKLGDKYTVSIKPISESGEKE